MLLRIKLPYYDSAITRKIYTHPNFDLAMHYVNQVPKYGEKSDQLKLTKRKTKKPSFKRAN